MDLLSKVASNGSNEPDYEKLSEYAKLFTECEQQLMKKYFTQYLQKQLRDKAYGGPLQAAHDAVASQYVKAQFITINFNDKYPPAKTGGIIDCISKLKWVSNIQWTLEQRSETSDWSGYHIHMLVDTKKPKSEVIRELFKLKILKDYIGSKQSIDVHRVTTLAAYENHKNYMFGDKADSSKHKKQKQDVLMRQFYGIAVPETSQGLGDAPAEN